MSRRSADDIADEIAAAITARIVATDTGPSGTEILIDGRRMHLDSPAFHDLIGRTYWQDHQRGIRPAVRAQVARNVAAWCRYEFPRVNEPEPAA